MTKMTKLYPVQKLVPTTPEGIKLINDIIDLKLEAREELSAKDYDKWYYQIHESLRQHFDIPYKVFAIGRNSDKTNVAILLFDKEPDRNVYDVQKDDNGIPYISVPQ